MFTCPSSRPESTKRGNSGRSYVCPSGATAPSSCQRNNFRKKHTAPSSGLRNPQIGTSLLGKDHEAPSLDSMNQIAPFLHWSPLFGLVRALENSNLFDVPGQLTTYVNSILRVRRHHSRTAGGKGSILAARRISRAAGMDDLFVGAAACQPTSPEVTHWQSTSQLLNLAEFALALLSNAKSRPASLQAGPRLRLFMWANAGLKKCAAFGGSSYSV
jgi:hypothetical protein